MSDQAQGDTIMREMWDNLFCPACEWNLKGQAPNRFCTHCDYKERPSEHEAYGNDCPNGACDV